MRNSPGSLPGGRAALWGHFWPAATVVSTPAVGTTGSIRASKDWKTGTHWHAAGWMNAATVGWQVFSGSQCLPTQTGMTQPKSAFIEFSLGRTPSRHIQNEELYGRPGLTFPNMAGISNVQPMAAGQVFSIKGQGVFVRDESQLLLFLAPAKWVTLFWGRKAGFFVNDLMFGDESRRVLGLLLCHIGPNARFTTDLKTRCQQNGS